MIDLLGNLRAVASQHHLHNGVVAASLIQPGPSAVLDRQRLTAAKPGNAMHNSVVEPPGGRTADGEVEKPSGDAMGEVFVKLEGLKEGIARVSEVMHQIKRLKQEAVQATSPETEKRVSKALTDLVDKSNKDILRLKTALEALKKENAEFSAAYPNSAEAKMRENMHAAVTRKFRDVLKNYQSVQTDYKKEVREKVSRQVQLVFPEASPEEVSTIVDNGDMSSAAAIRLRIGGIAHESLTNALSDLQDKYRDIRLLEQSVGELHQMFVDLATLVEAQGELLDQIEFSVNSAKDYVGKGEKELVEARKGQRKAKKRTCIISTCIVIVALVVIVGLVVPLSRF